MTKAKRAQSLAASLLGTFTELIAANTLPKRSAIALQDQPNALHLTYKIYYNQDSRSSNR
jgi:hypothetical protein